MYSRYSFILHGALAVVLLLWHILLQRIARFLPFDLLAPSPATDGLSADLTNHIVVITGANTGIGKVTARKLACRGATVILACRDDQRGLEAAADINKQLKAMSTKEHPFAGKGKAQYMRLDLSDLHSVLDFSIRYRQQHSRLDILVNNAGMNTDALLPNGLQQLFQVNYLGHYLLVRCLLDMLVAVDGQGPAAARIINLSSVMHHNGQPNYKLSALRMFNSSMRASYSYYSDSKLYMNLLTMELNQRLSDSTRLDISASLLNHCQEHAQATKKRRPVLSLSVNPGAVSSDIWRSVPLRAIFDAVTAVVFLDVEQGSEGSVFAATLPEEVIRDYMSSHQWGAMETGRMCQRGDLPYIIPYAMHWTSLAFELAGPFAGPRFSSATIPLRSSATQGPREKNLHVDFDNPRDLAAGLWTYSAETCHRVLLQSGVPKEQIDFLK